MSFYCTDVECNILNGRYVVILSFGRVNLFLLEKQLPA